MSPGSLDDPHLSRNFLPVQREVDARDLRVVSGRIPADLRGVYMRNGPNPEFKPLGYAYPLDGDGMIHAVYIEDGKARYRNRFVKTESLTVERRAGHAVFGSFAHPVPVDPAVFVAGRSSVATQERCVRQHHPPRRPPDRAQRGHDQLRDEHGTGHPRPVDRGRHRTDPPGRPHRHHPRTGDLYALEYSWRTPTVKFHRIDSSGRLVNTRSIDLPMPTMGPRLHPDPSTTWSSSPGRRCSTPQAAKAGQSMLQWRPDLGMRIALLPLDGGAPIWIEGDPFFVFHFGNGFERGRQIVVDYVQHDKFALANGPTPTFKRMTIDPVRRNFKVASYSSEGDRVPALQPPSRGAADPVRLHAHPDVVAQGDRSAVGGVQHAAQARHRDWPLHAPRPGQPDRRRGRLRAEAGRPARKTTATWWPSPMTRCAGAATSC